MNDSLKFKYSKNHRILAESSFVRWVNEGYLDDVHSAFYDFVKIYKKQWNTIEAITPKPERQNDNGKF